MKLNQQKQQHPITPNTPHLYRLARSAYTYDTQANVHNTQTNAHNTQTNADNTQTNTDNATQCPAIPNTMRTLPNTVQYVTPASAPCARNSTLGTSHIEKRMIGVQ